MKRNIKASNALKAQLKTVKGKKVKGTIHYYIYENGVVLNKKTGYATVGSTGGNTPYNSVTIFQNGRKRTVEVQRLMAECFLNANWKVNANKQTNHKDGNFNNNNLSNLELVTRQQNVDHAINVLGRRFGRITNDEVYEIRTRFTNYANPKVGIKNLAKRYNISQQAVTNIINKVTYTNV